MGDRSGLVGRARAAVAGVDPRRCTSCGECAAACPRGAIREPSGFCCAKCVKYCLAMEVPCTPAVFVVCAELCDGCGACVPACPTGAIAMRGAEAAP